VIDRLRIFLNRPLADAERRGLFLLAVVVIVAAVGAFTLVDEPGVSERAAPPRADRAPEPSTGAAPEPVALEAPSEEGELPADGEPSDAEVRAAKRAARRFLEGYLPYTYGQGSANRILAADEELRDRLQEERPRVPAGERRRTPRVLLVQAEGAGPVRARLVALVDDGARRYTVPLELEQQRSGWIVTTAGS
jgi:hypothetical protein